MSSCDRNTGRKSPATVTALREVISSVFKRLRFTVQGSGADQLGVDSDSQGNVVLTFNPDPSDGGAAAYLYVAWASDSSGTGFTTTFNPALKYVAFLNTTEPVTPTVDLFEGMWVKYVGDDGLPGDDGEDGVDGVDGMDGSDGLSAYVYIAWASDASGTDFTATFNPSLPYIAFRNSTSPLTPTVDDFAGLWVRYIGVDGDDGADGTDGDDGVDGVSAYIYVGYAEDAEGTGFSTSPGETRDFVAFKTSSTPLTPIVTDFAGLWFYTKGAAGDDGVDGADGEDGLPGFSGFQWQVFESTSNTTHGQANFDASVASSVTELKIHKTAIVPGAGEDLSSYLGLFASGDVLYVSSGASAAVFWLASDPVYDAPNNQFVIELEGGVGIAVPTAGATTGFVFTKSFAAPTASEIRDAYESQRELMSQTEAETGTETTVRLVNALRIRQAVDARVSQIIDGSPATLDTLNELAAALGDDPNFATTMATALAGKQPIDATLTAFAALAGAADKLPYFSGADTFSLADFTSAARTLLACADAAAMRTALGVDPAGTVNYTLPVATTTTIGGVKRNTGSEGQYVSGFDSAGSALYGTPVSGYRPALNAIINGDMRVAQRGTLFTPISDATYCVDRWYALCETGTLDIGQEYADGYAELYVEANSGTSKFGVCQILENRDLHDLAGKTVTLSFRARCTPNADLGLSAAICVWTGTDDAPTRDLVSTWNASGANPGLVANWSIVGSDTSISPGDSTSMTTYTKTITLPSSINNLAVFIFAKNSTNVAAGDAFYLTDVQLEIGSSATSFQRPTYADSLARCQRYYEPIRYNSAGQGLVSNFYSGTTHVHTWYYRATKFKTPTVSLVTGSWTGGTPTITPSADTCYFNRAAGAFIASGTVGDIALAADAEL